MPQYMRKTDSGSKAKLDKDKTQNTSYSEEFGLKSFTTVIARYMFLKFKYQLLSSLPTS